MPPVILSAADARRRCDPSPREVEWCTCTLAAPRCECGGEAEVVPLSSVSTADAGWRVAR